MKTNKIGWCHKTINPFVGCTFNCTFKNTNGGDGGCYARLQAKRQKHNCSECYSFTPHLHLERVKLVTPRQKPKRIFVGSMADIADFVDMKVTKQDIPKNLPDYLYTIGLDFGRELTVPEVLNFWFMGCRQHTFMLLTKRPWTLAGLTFPDNVWVGVTITNSTEQSRFHSLVQTGCSPAGNYFVSLEPMLESITWTIDAQPRWAIIGGLSRPGREPIPPQRDWLVRITSFFRDGENIPVYVKENARYGTFLAYQEFPPGFPVYENEVR